MITSSPNRSECCAKCRSVILDKYYLATKDGVYHSACLRCVHCDLELDGQVNCYNRNGQIYCRTDYERLFHQSATVCSKCGLTVQVGQFVHSICRADSVRLFHLECFKCAICDTVLQPGQRYAFLQAELFCELHFTNSSKCSLFLVFAYFQNSLHRKRCLNIGLLWFCLLKLSAKESCIIQCGLATKSVNKIRWRASLCSV